MCQVFAGQDPDRYASTTRRLRLNGQSTSIRLENAFWQILDDIAEADGVSTPAFLSKLHSEVLETRGEPENFTSLLRTTCLLFLSQPDRSAHQDGPAPLAAE
ncbi:MAG: ribbon-helix-helix domain-containing protein [Neomegalonema sp.]|nr:ribbon-helix-helix domain-containing protein [Neomegalonema sp.]